MIIILAGNYTQAEDYARRKQIEKLNWIYASDISRLGGVLDAVLDANFVRVGTWSQRHQNREIEDYLIAIGIKEIPE